MSASPSSQSSAGWSESDDWYDPDPPSRLRGMSWLISAMTHAGVFLAAAVVLNPTPPAGNAAPERRAGIVLVDLSQEKPQYFTPGDDTGTAGELAANSGQAADASAPGSTNSSNSPNANSLAAALPGAAAPPIDASGVLPSGEGISAAEVAGAGGSGGGQLLGGGAGGLAGPRGLGKPAHTYVFGLPGVGSKFLYVFDRSASMSGFEGRPMSAAKRELSQSLRALESTHQFQIIFYNNRPSVFNPFSPQPPRLVFGEDKNKRLAEDFVRSVVADGGTDHMLALNLGLSLAPDVMFFLTDADDPQLTEPELAKIRTRNRGTVINAIEFGAGPQRSAGNFLVRLAQQNGGRHAYVDVTQLAP
jgi:hypothetical protein